MVELASLTTKVFLFVTLVTTASAQIALNPRQPDVLACVEKSDAYKLALADMQGTLGELWSRFVKEGRCRLLPAIYLFSLDTYRDSDNEPSRVIEMLFMGGRVWGIRGRLPDGVWFIDLAARRPPPSGGGGNGAQKGLDLLRTSSIYEE